jgi:hypothetical protein
MNVTRRGGGGKFSSVKAQFAARRKGLTIRGINPLDKRVDETTDVYTAIAGSFTAMSDSLGEGQRTPVNDGWQGLRLGQTPAGNATVAKPLPAATTGGVSSSPKAIPYAQRAYPVSEDSRPGILTALGVMSIVVGAITLLINCGLMAAWGYGYLVASDRQRSAAGVMPTDGVPPTPAVIVPTPTQLTAYTGDCIAVEGLPRPARRAVIEAVQAKRATMLSLDRAAMLDRLLAETGAAAFGPDGKLAGDMPDEQAGPKVEPAPTVRISTARGLVELADNAAMFTPAGSNKPSVRITRNVVVTPQSRRYSAVAIVDAMEAARSAAGGNLNAVQGAVVLDELRRASVRERGDGRFEVIPIGEISGSTNGTVGLTVGDRSIWIFADGRTMDRRLNPREPNPVTGAPLTAPAPMRRWTPQTAAAGPAIDAASVALVGLVEAAIGLALAVLVLSAGIRLLNNSPPALPQHARYAVLKALLFAATIITWYFGHSSPVGPVGRGIASSAYQIARQIGFVVGLMSQIAYPVAILCVLSNGRVRRYARGLGCDYGVLPTEAWGRLRVALDTSAGRRVLTTGGLGALVVAGLHGWCTYCAVGPARTPHLAALAGAVAVALGCLARRMTTVKKSTVAAAVAALMITLSARGQSVAPTTHPATRPTPAPKIILQLGKPVAKPLDAPAATAPAVGAVTAPAAKRGGPPVGGEAEWFDGLQSMALAQRAHRLAAMQDIDKLVVTEAARPNAIKAVPQIAEVLLSTYPGLPQAMTLLEKIGPCAPVEDACIRVMVAPSQSLEALRPRAVALALAFDPSGKSATTRLRPYVLSGHGLAYVQRSAARSMAGLGSAGIAELNALAHGPNESVRRIVLAALADSAPVETRLNTMTQLLDDESLEMRKDAANALAAIGPAGRDVLIGRSSDRPECLRALERLPAGRDRAMLSSLSVIIGPQRLNRKSAAAIIDVMHLTETGRQAAADRALLDCVESDEPALRQWALSVIGNGDFLHRAGPVTQEHILALMGQVRSSPVARMPVLAAPTAPADAAPWVVPTKAAMWALARAPSEPPSGLAWWVTGGFAMIMTFCMKRLSRTVSAQAEQDDEMTSGQDSLRPPGLAA